MNLYLETPKFGPATSDGARDRGVRSFHLRPSNTEDLAPKGAFTQHNCDKASRRADERCRISATLRHLCESQDLGEVPGRQNTWTLGGGDALQCASEIRAGEGRVQVP